MIPKILGGCLAAIAGLLVATEAGAQEGPAKRLASIVGVAVEEYAKGVDARGRLVSDIEYQEAVDFLRDAKDVAARLSGERAPGIRETLDSLIAAVGQRRTPEALNEVYRRFTTALGSDGTLDLPTRRINVAGGRALYDQHCASCHGATGRGDGPSAKGMSPPPPALGTRDAMADVTPALMYRVISVGIAGTPMAGWAATLTPDQRWDLVSYINSLRFSRAEVAQGEGLYALRCGSCHGMTGAAEGSFATALSKLPPEVGSFAWQVEQSDAQIAAIARAGREGTAMPSARDLDSAQMTSVVAYVRSLAERDEPGSATAAVSPSDTGSEAVSRRVMALLDDALAAARSGRKTDANDRAFDAYLAFEPLETPGRARQPGVVASMERHFADFKGAVRAGDLRLAERSRNAVEQGLPGIVELTRPATGFWGKFFESFLIILREGFEAILVIGAVVTFLTKTGHRERLRSIWVGVILALVASLATAIVLATVLRALPATREIIEGGTMLVAVAVLFSVSYWLISKVEAARWQQFIRDKVNAALSHGGGKALAIVAFLAVYREGAETALFYQALFHDGPRSILPITLGIVIGGIVLTAVFVLFHRFGVKLPLRPFFAVTSVLLYYMAFVFMGKGVRELQEGNVVSITVIPWLPSVEAMGIFPSVETMIAQLILVALFVFALLKTFWPKRSVTLPTMPMNAPPATPPSVPATPASEPRVRELVAKVHALEARIAQLEDALNTEPNARR
jgi:high-affinity iron transporter